MATKFYKGLTPLLSQPSLGGQLMGRAYIGGQIAYGAEPVIFDPTLGGTITPYMWYDFTDSSTMTFSSGNNIEAIYSKGTNAGELRKTNTANFIAPTWDGSYTSFYGGTGHSKLSRRYSTDGTNGSGDSIFNVNNAYTMVCFVNPLFTVSQAYRQLVSIKSYNIPSGPDEYNPIACDGAAGFTGTSNWSSTNTSYYPSIYSFHWKITDYAHRYSFNGATPAGWNSWVSVQNGNQVYAGRTLSNTSGTSNGNYSVSSNSNYENLTIGGRSRTDANYGANWQVSHVLFYNSILTSTNVDDLITNYQNAGGFTLNQVNN